MTYCPKNDLIIATWYGQFKKVKALLADGFDVNARDSDDKTPLMIASSLGNKELVQILIDCQADIDASSKDGWTALHQAVFLEDYEVVEILLKNGADPEFRDYEQHYNAFEWSIILNLFDIAQLLIQYGAKVYSEHVKGMLFLMDTKKRYKYYELLDV